MTNYSMALIHHMLWLEPSIREEKSGVEWLNECELAEAYWKLFSVLLEDLPEGTRVHKNETGHKI